MTYGFWYWAFFVLWFVVAIWRGWRTRTVAGYYYYIVGDVFVVVLLLIVGLKLFPDPFGTLVTR
jgi:hypothetical protein